jgi:hypothetical protein
MIIRRPGDPDRTTGDEPTTYHALAQAGIELEGTGRFAADVRVVGTTPTAAELYPAAGVAPADVGEELPTGDDQRPEPTGTPAEIAASIARGDV